jgi:hypothetical protein
MVRRRLPLVVALAGWVFAAALLLGSCGGAHKASPPPIHLYKTPAIHHTTRKQTVFCVGPGGGTALVSPTKKQERRLFREAKTGKYHVRTQGPGTITLHYLPSGKAVGTCNFGPPTSIPSNE